MDVREKLVKQAISHFRHGVSHDIFSEPVTTYAKLAIEALEKENGVTVQEWVPVTERLPEDSGYYLVVHRNKYNGSISIAFEMYIKCKIGEWWENDYEYDVTHWMLLPEMPKED